MQLLEDGIVAALAAVGLAALLYLLISALVRPRCRGTLDALAAVPCRAGETARLEYTVRALERARDECGGLRRIVILDLGMDDEAKRLAAVLCREKPDVFLCRSEELQEYIRQ